MHLFYSYNKRKSIVIIHHYQHHQTTTTIYINRLIYSVFDSIDPMHSTYPLYLTTILGSVTAGDVDDGDIGDGDDFAVVDYDDDDDE